MPGPYDAAHRDRRCVGLLELMIKSLRSALEKLLPRRKSEKPASLPAPSLPRATEVQSEDYLPAYIKNKDANQLLYEDYKNEAVQMLITPKKAKVKDLMRWPAYLFKTIELHKDQPYFDKLKDKLDAMECPWGLYDVFVIHELGCNIFGIDLLCNCDPDIEIKKKTIFVE